MHLEDEEILPSLSADWITSQVLERLFSFPNKASCKGILPLCVVLVINDNPYGLMFSLSLYEGIFHKVLLVVHVLVSSMDAMKIKIYLVYWHQDHRFEDIYVI